MKKIGYAPGFQKPTPYLREMFDKLELPKDANILDLATGNGRNARFVLDKGYDNVYCFDRIQNPTNNQVDYINLWEAGSPIDGLPDIGLFLVQYLFCFLSKTKKRQVASQMNKVAGKNALAIIEVQSTKTAGNIEIDEIIPFFKRWEILHKRKNRCIIRKID